MKHYKTAAFFCIIHLMVLVQPLQAQHTADTQTLSLEEIWKAVQTHNRQLKLSDLNLQQSQIEVVEAKDRRLPELTLVADLKLNSKFLLYDDGLFSSPQDVPVRNYGYAAGYSLNFNLFNSGKDRRNITMKKEEASRRQYEADLQRHSVKYHAAAAYFDLYKALHFHDFLTAEIQTENKQLTLIESLHKNGTVLKSDVLRSSVKVAQLELSLSQIDKKIEIARQRLNILMGRDPEAILIINYHDAILLDDIPPAPYSDYAAATLNKSPEYQIANSDIKWSELNIKQIKTTLLPKVSLYSAYQYTYPQISFYPYSNDLWGFGQTGIKAQFAVDNLYKSRHSIARAQMIFSQAKEKADMKKDDILLQLKEAYLQEQQALESAATAEKNIAKSTETVRVIRNSYLHQEALLTDLMEAENALLEAKFNLTTAQTDLQLHHIRLLAIAGIL